MSVVPPYGVTRSTTAHRAGCTGDKLVCASASLAAGGHPGGSGRGVRLANSAVRKTVSCRRTFLVGGRIVVPLCTLKPTRELLVLHFLM